MDLFTRCKQLEYVRFHFGLLEQGRWHEAFRRLTRDNQSLRSLQLECGIFCLAFDDQCLRQFMKGRCPNLNQLTIPLNSCSLEVIEEFKAERPNVEIDLGVNSSTSGSPKLYKVGPGGLVECNLKSIR